MDEPMELHDIVGHTTSVDRETVCDVPELPNDDENKYMKIDGVADVKSETDTAALKKVQILCLVLLMMLITSSVTVGVLVNLIMQRTDELQLKISELQSRPGYLTGTDSTNIQELQSKIIQLEKDRSSRTSMIQDLDSRITTLGVDTAANDNTIKEFGTRISNIETDNATDTTSYHQLNNTLEQLVMEVSSTKEEIEIQQIRLNEIVFNYSLSIDQIYADLEAARISLANLSSRVKINEIGVLSDNAAIEDNQQRISRVEMDSNVTDSLLQTMESRLTYLQDGLNCTWGNWTSFSSCSATCGDGLHYRERSLEGLVTDNNRQWCARKEMDIQTCIIKSCKSVNDGWGQWGSFSNCSRACGGGTRMRQRACDNPEPLNGGALCLGDTIETQTCNTDPCPAAEDCSGFTSGSPTGGVYNISSDRSLTKSVPVYCEFTSDGAWTVIQKRFDGSVDFNRTWQEYKTGFGDVYGEYWLGNDAIQKLTSHATYQLKIRLTDWDDSTKFANFRTFRLANESDGYRLSIGGYSGNAGDSMRWNNGYKFSTRDVDNDKSPLINCAVLRKGAWWYPDCGSSNLNGLYHHSSITPIISGIYWGQWHGQFYSLKATTLMIQANRSNS